MGGQDQASTRFNASESKGPNKNTGLRKLGFSDKVSLEQKLIKQLTT